MIYGLESDTYIKPDQDLMRYTISITNKKLAKQNAQLERDLLYAINHTDDDYLDRIHTIYVDGLSPSVGCMTDIGLDFMANDVAHE